MKIIPIHRWDLSPKEGTALQRELAERVRLAPLPRPPRTVAGVDVSYDKGSDRFHAGIVLLSFPGMALIAEAWATAQVSFPYVPGLLSFSEGPVVLQAFEKLKEPPDLILFDGQGIAHPRGLGLAAHLGLILGLPSVGCAKTRLCGDHEEPGMERGDRTPLLMEGQPVGAVVRTKRGVKPLFVSPGHLIDIEGSIEVVLACSGGYRLPEPTRLAHLLVNRVRRGEAAES